MVSVKCCLAVTDCFPLVTERAVAMVFDLADGINWYLVFLFSISLHEAAHAWAASHLGDDTAKLAGQITLDPTPHVKRAPFGTVIVPLVSYFLTGGIIGWAHAPYDPKWARQYPARSALMAIAGPLANLTMALIALILIRIGSEWRVLWISENVALGRIVCVENKSSFLGFLANMLSITYRLNIFLGVFNLLPLPPLDGSKIPLFFLPSILTEKYWTFLCHPYSALIGTYTAWQLFGMGAPKILEISVDILRFVTQN